MGKHLPGVVWLIRSSGANGPFPIGVRTVGVAAVEVFQEPNFASIRLERRDARLLAKRINQCLDQTRS